MKSLKKKILKTTLLFISFAAAFGQSGSFGNTFILKGGEYNFQADGGVLHSDKAGLSSFMSFGPNSSYINSWLKVHLEGYVRYCHSMKLNKIIMIKICV